MPDIDLPPHQWTSDRAKPREPIFGPGWPAALGYLLQLFLTIAFIQLFHLH
jgi:hypothetical protein